MSAEDGTILQVWRRLERGCKWDNVCRAENTEHSLYSGQSFITVTTEFFGLLIAQSCVSWLQKNPSKKCDILSVLNSTFAFKRAYKSKVSIISI